jgi:hypothetical protein
MNQNLSEKIKEILVPKLNEFIADSAIRVNCKRIGTSPEELNPSQLSEFAEKIKITLLLFLEEKEAEEIVQRIKEIGV